MDTKIKEWIQLARRISKHLLTSAKATKKDSGEIDNTTFKIPAELKKPGYYAQKAIRKQELNKKYTWEEFQHTQKHKIRQRKIQRWGYAASIILLIGAGSTVLWLNQQPAKTEIALLPQPELVAGGAKASLILSNGQEIALNNQLTLTEKDGTLIQNNESGEIAYQTDNSADTDIQYNTLRVPRGGEYRIVLPDGTKVWINSESELRYPTRFATKKREVFLKGEAYFEIAHNTSQPFFVHSNDLQVHATGTAFDVIAYQDEPEMKVILVEGGVNIENQHNIISKLSPSHEFRINKANGEFQVSPVDIRTAAAWKNGIFFFNDETLGSIIRKLSRWYNIDIQCAHAELYQYKFSGTIRKYENANDVLDMLKLTNEINYKILPDKKVLLYTTE